MLGRFEDAIWHYERFLERGKPTGEVEAAARKFIAQMKAELHKQPPPKPTSASVASIGSPRHTPLVSNKSSEKHSGMPLRWNIGIGIGGAGVASLCLGLGFGFRARSFKDDAAAICPMSTCDRASEANGLIGRGQTNARYANLAFGLGGAAIFGATVLLIAGASTEPKRVAIVPHISPNVTSVAASLRF
jgi:hypothetical protein